MFQSLRQHIERRKEDRLYRVSGMSMARKDRTVRFLQSTRINSVLKFIVGVYNWLFRMRSFVWHSGMYTFSMTFTGIRSMFFIFGFVLSTSLVVLLLQGIIVRHSELQTSTEEIAEIQAIFANLREELRAAKANNEINSETADRLIERTEQYDQLMHAFRVDGEFIRTRGRLVEDVSLLRGELAAERFELYKTRDKLAVSSESNTVLLERNLELESDSTRIQDELIAALSDQEQNDRLQIDFATAIESYVDGLEVVTGAARPTSNVLRDQTAYRNYIVSTTTEIFDYYSRQDEILRKAEELLNDDITTNFRIIEATQFPLKRLRGADIIKTGLGGPLSGELAADLEPVPHVYQLEGLQRMQEQVASKIEIAHFLQNVRDCMPLNNPLGRNVKRVSSGFGFRADPFTRKKTFHGGIDYGVWYGTSIYATAPGTVHIARTRGGYGKVIEIDHGCGFKTRYAHLQKMFVSPGDRVTNSTLIAHSGNTGRSTGPHLHYEVLFNNRQVNPIHFVEAINNAQ